MIDLPPLLVVGDEVGHELPQDLAVDVVLLLEIDEPLAEEMVYGVRDELPEDRYVAVELRAELAVVGGPLWLVALRHVAVPQFKNNSVKARLILHELAGDLPLDCTKGLDVEGLLLVADFCEEL